MAGIGVSCDDYPLIAEPDISVWGDVSAWLDSRDNYGNDKDSYHDEEGEDDE